MLEVIQVTSIVGAILVLWIVVKAVDITVDESKTLRGWFRW